MSNPLAEVATLKGVAPVSIAPGNSDGTAIDYAATYEAEATVILTCGVLGAAATALAKLQESDDGSTNWTDVTNATTATAVKATDDGKVFTATGRVAKRFVRVRVTVATAASIAGAVILAKPRTISA
jgi:outer membrane protein assembly factor BamB